MDEVAYIPIFHDQEYAALATERRLPLRLMAYWERLRGDRLMPSENDINPDGEISDMWDDCFLIHTANIHQEDYNFIYLGKNIKAALTGGIDDADTSSWQSLNVKRMAPDLQQVIERAAPVVHEGEMVNDANQLVKFRQCLLPLGNHNKVLAIFGGMRCKIYP